MQKMILIPEERYYKMLESYDRIITELEQMKKPLKKRQLLQRQSNPEIDTKAGLRLL